MKFEARHDNPSHPALLVCPMALGLIYVEGHERPGVVLLVGCEEPNCTCTEFTFTFFEVDDHGDPLPNGFDIVGVMESTTLSLLGDVDIASADRVLLEAAFAAVPRDVLREAVAGWREHKNVIENLAAARISASDVRQGVLQSWTRLALYKAGDAVGGSPMAGHLHWQGREWAFDVCYCPNPRCDCRAFHVQVCVIAEGSIGASQAPIRAEATALLTGWFKGDKLKVEEVYLGDHAEALAVTRAWLATVPGYRQRFAQEYREVRDVARRSLQEANSQGPQVVEPKIPRNADCPCGSGKKYKRCCGA